MPDPITTAIATAIAGSAATALSAEATRIIKEITARIRHKLHGDPHTPDLPADPRDADGLPGDPDAFAEHLHQAFQKEPDFAEEIRALWEDYRHATASTATNNFHGDAHTSIMVTEHHGDINISN